VLVGVISDTHMQNDYIKRALDHLKKCDFIIHLGDNTRDVNEIKKYYNKKIISVKGNCDYSENIPTEKIEVLGNKKFFITHGHNYNVKGTLINLRYKAMEVGADIVLFGHTHIAMEQFEEGIWFINPGSAGLARNGKNSVAIIEIRDEKIIPSIKLI
jgi:putative phosphoesterase